MFRAHRIAVVLVALLVAACGGGDEEPTTTTTSTTTTSTTTTTLPPPTLSALTGEEVDDEIVERPVVAIKIDNRWGKSTPQVGIRAADVVYEIQVEGSVTRLLSLFQSEDVAPVGPIRSARGSEIGVLEELNSPLFTWHGANTRLRSDVRNSTVVPRSIDDIPSLFYREASRPAPYNSFAVGTEQIRDTAPEGSTGPTEPILTFAEDTDEPPSPLAVDASTVTILFPTWRSTQVGIPIRYDWDPTSETWLRFQNGKPHLDADGFQVGVENVIVRYTEAVDSGTRDTVGSVVPTAVVTGEGEAWVFSRGTVTIGTWSKADNFSRTHYDDEAGDEIELTPGTTWISMPFGHVSSYE